MHFSITAFLTFLAFLATALAATCASKHASVAKAIQQFCSNKKLVAPSTYSINGVKGPVGDSRVSIIGMSARISSRGLQWAEERCAVEINQCTLLFASLALADTFVLQASASHPNGCPQPTAQPNSPKCARTTRRLRTTVDETVNLGYAPKSLSLSPLFSKLMLYVADHQVRHKPDQRHHVCRLLRSREEDDNAAAYAVV